MSPTTTTNLQHMTLDGPITVSVAVVLCIVLLALFLWSLHREQRVLGRRTTGLFLLLRTIALGTVLWMLLAPTNVTVETSTTRRAIAIVTDVSGSMQTIDARGTSDDLRWFVSTSSDFADCATRSADKAIAAVGVATRELRAAAVALQERKPESLVVASAVAADRALHRAGDHLRALQEATHVSASSRSLAKNAESTLLGAEFEAYSRLCRALERGRVPAEKGWRESLPDIEERLRSLRRPMQELARHVGAEERRRVTEESQPQLTSIGTMPRLSRAAAFIGQLDETVLPAVRDNADVHLRAFDRSVEKLTDPETPQDSLRSFLTPAGVATQHGTDLAAMLEQLRREQHEQSLAAVFVVSDMAHNAINADPRDAAATLVDTPVYVIPIGNTQRERDVVLQSVSAPNIAMRNDDIVVEARLQAYECAGEVCTVQLRQDDELIDFREVRLDSGFASRTVRFEQHMPSMGDQRFQVSIVPLKDELTDENNGDEFEVHVTRSDIKVLLADEMPRWEYGYLTRLFRRDAKVECDELLFRPRMIATGRRAESKTFPVNVDEWDQYDVVILGDLPIEHLPVVSQAALVEYLKQRGGTLVMIAGQQAMPHAYADHPLHDVLPVEPIDLLGNEPETFELRLTQEGQDHDALMIADSDEATRVAWDFVNRFSPLHSVSRWRKPRPSAHTLISAVPKNGDEDVARTSAFLCWQSVGRGRVIYLSGPDTYRLRFLRGDRLHYRFWGQLLRWAIASDLSVGTDAVRIRTAKSRYRVDEEIDVTVRLTDPQGQPVTAAEGLRVRVSSDDSEHSFPLSAHTEIPGQYQGQVRSLPPGDYQIEPIGKPVDALRSGADQPPPTTSFTVQKARPLELLDTRSDRALAQQIADVTGGQVLPPTAVEEIVHLTDLEPIVSERMETRPLWLEWKYLWIVFGCLQFEWIIRKWKGWS